MSTAMVSLSDLATEDRTRGIWHLPRKMAWRKRPNRSYALSKEGKMQRLKLVHLPEIDSILLTYHTFQAKLDFSSCKWRKPNGFGDTVDRRADLLLISDWMTSSRQGERIQASVGPLKKNHPRYERLAPNRFVFVMRYSSGNCQDIKPSRI